MLFKIQSTHVEQGVGPHFVIIGAFCMPRFVTKTAGFVIKKVAEFCNKDLPCFVIKNLSYFVISFTSFCNKGRTVFSKIFRTCNNLAKNFAIYGIVQQIVVLT